MALILFTGPVRSGKSDAAVALAEERMSRGDLSGVTIAVFTDAAGDPEFQRRVDHHRATRPPEWQVLECFSDPLRVTEVGDERLLIVDCIGTAIGASMGFDPDVDTHGLADAAAQAVDRLASALARRQGDTIVVTNEVGWGIVPSTPAVRLFRDLVGRANRLLAGVADTAYLVVAGRLIDLKALDTIARWPED